MLKSLFVGVHSDSLSLGEGCGDIPPFDALYSHILEHTEHAVVVDFHDTDSLLAVLPHQVVRMGERRTSGINTAHHHHGWTAIVKDLNAREGFVGGGGGDALQRSSRPALALITEPQAVLAWMLHNPYDGLYIGWWIFHNGWDGFSNARDGDQVWHGWLRCYITAISPRSLLW